MAADGGIALDKTLTLLNEVDNLRGAAYDPTPGEFVFVGEGMTPVNETVKRDDCWQQCENA